MEIDTSKELAWDLRTAYSTIVSLNLFRIDEYRAEQNFTKWYYALKNLFTIVKHLIDEKKSPTFEDLEREAIIIFNKYPAAFQNNQGSNAEIAQIIAVLQKMDSYLLEKMQKAKMFGAKYYEGI